MLVRCMVRRDLFHLRLAVSPSSSVLFAPFCFYLKMCAGAQACSQ